MFSLNNLFTDSKYRVLSLILIISPTQLNANSTNTETIVSNSQKTLSRSMDAITLSGEDLPGIMNTDITNIRLFSSRRGETVAIPFQIDQRDIDEQWIWKKSSGAERTHDDDDPDNEDIFDGNDILVFIAKDIGNKIKNDAIPGKPDIIYEIILTDPVDNSKGWVYLAHFPHNAPALSTQRYIHFDKSARTIKTSNYEFIYSDKHLAVMETLRLNGQSILDRTKVRGQIDLDLFLFETTIDFNEEEIGGYNEGYIDGPVRLIKRSINHLVIEGMDAPNVVCDHYFYPEYSELPIAITMQFPVKKVKLKITGDYFGGQFNRIYVENSKNPIILSSKSIDTEWLNTAADANWMALDGEFGSIILSIKSPELLKPYLLISPFLAVDQSGHFPPESIPGVNPEAGFNIETIESFPTGKYVLHAVYKFSDRQYEKDDPTMVTQLLHQPLQYSTFQTK
jgi:hypothetical protein